MFCGRSVFQSSTPTLNYRTLPFIALPIIQLVLLHRLKHP